MPVNLGIIGCSEIAERHARAIRELPSGRLAACADTVPERAQSFAAKFDADWCTDYHELLSRSDVDIVNICVPSHLHAQLATDAMHAGKHVLVEKPIALTVKDADDMIATARRSGVKMGVVLQNRYNPPMQALRSLVDAGRLGKLLSATVTVRWTRPQSYYDHSWHGSWARGGGVLLNQCIHHIDAMQWLMGDADTVFAYTDTLAHCMDADDVGVAVVRFKSGALGVIECSTFAYPRNLEGSVTLLGENGLVQIGGTHLNRVSLWKVKGQLEGETEMLTKHWSDPSAGRVESHKAVITDMIEAVLNNRSPVTDGAEARRSLQLVLAMYESARSGREVCVTDVN